MHAEYESIGLRGESPVFYVALELERAAREKPGVSQAEAAGAVRVWRLRALRACVNSRLTYVG